MCATYTYWVVPLPNTSDHQDCYIFNRESLSTFVCHCYWEGGKPNTYMCVYLHLYTHIYIYVDVIPTHTHTIFTKDLPMNHMPPECLPTFPADHEPRNRIRNHDAITLPWKKSHLPTKCKAAPTYHCLSQVTPGERCSISTKPAAIVPSVRKLQRLWLRSQHLPGSCDHKLDLPSFWTTDVHNRGHLERNVLTSSRGDQSALPT